MDKKIKVWVVSMIFIVLFMVTVTAHINPRGKQTHPVGIETDSCQGALLGAEQQVQDRSEVNPRLLDNILDKCGIECSVEFGEWTQWFDRDNPSGTGDWETLNALRDENFGEICDNPTQIECRTLDGIDYTQTGDVVICTIDTGLICLNSENIEGCEDYEIKVYCEEPALVCEEEIYCVEVDPRTLFQGACTDTSWIDENNLPKCCTTETPYETDCEVEQEWVVGFADSPGCYVSNS